MAGHLRILHVHSGNLYGGVETMMLAMVRHRELCPEMESSFALCFADRLAHELTIAGAEIHPLSEVKIRRLDSVWRARRQLAVLLRERRFDVVMTHSSWSQAIFGPVVRESGLPLVNYLHGAASGRHWLERAARRTPPDLLIANSRFTADTAKNIYPNTRCEVIYPMFAPIPGSSATITSAERTRVRAELNTGEQATVIIQVSRMEAGKGHTLHLHALSRLIDVPNWICWQVGGAHRPEEARYMNGLTALAVNLGIADRVCFLGERHDVPRLLAAADIYCQPNTSPDSFGLTFVEALSAGLPVIVTALGGACEIVDDSCSCLIPVGDEQALAAVLQRLIDDPAVRARMGAAGPARVRQLCGAGMQFERLKNLCSTVAQRKAATAVV